MFVRRLVLILAVACAALPWIACHDCGFRLLWGMNVGGGTGSDAGTIGCCGAAMTFDVKIPEAEGAEVDLTNTSFPGQTGHVDAWLVEPGCDPLFEGTYPGASPRCRTYIGPVAPDQVSARVKIPAGSYRIVLQGYSSNASAAKYTAQVGLWGYNCKFNPAAP